MYNMLDSLLLLPLLILPSVTSWDTILASGSTSCVTDALCKSAPNHVDGFDCTANQPGNCCEVLAALYVRWETEAKVLSHLFKEVGKILEAAQVTQNATSQLLTDFQTLRGRQAVSGAVQVSQILMFVGYILIILILYMVKRCQKARERHQNQEFELLEQKLQANKAKCRAAAARAKSAPGPTPK